MNSVRTNVCIVGGGPGGMMLGLLLAKRGVDVLVLEGQENFDREFRGEVLQPSTSHLLDELGLLEYILAEPHNKIDSGKVRLGGREIAEFSFDRISPEYPYAIWMPQPIFLAALLRKAEPLPTFKCWMSAHVSKLIQENGCTVGVSGLQHGREPFEVRADVVVGADGRYSTVAKVGGFMPEYHHHDIDLIWFTIEQPPGWANTFYVSLGSKVRGLMLPKHPHHIQAGIGLPAGEWKEWRRKGIAFVADKVRQFDPIFVPFADSLKDFTPFFPLEGIIRLVDDWARDGLLLIGDAAHAMSPMGAIGVNVAIATAAVAAQEIYPLVGRGPIPRERLQEVQRLREPDVRTLHMMQNRAQQVMLGQMGRGPIMQSLINTMLPIMLRSPLLPRIQRRIFFGVPLPPLDPAFSFREAAVAV
jgi:2-polyprenyl-6-methoxyphenol hydroxylase-like FAD-dependent oxidoreductase